MRNASDQVESPPMSCKRSALNVAVFHARVAHGHLQRTLTEWAPEADLDRGRKSDLDLIIAEMREGLLEFEDELEAIEEEARNLPGLLIE